MRLLRIVFLSIILEAAALSACTSGMTSIDTEIETSPFIFTGKVLTASERQAIVLVDSVYKGDRSCDTVKIFLGTIPSCSPILMFHSVEKDSNYLFIMTQRYNKKSGDIYTSNSKISLKNAAPYLERIERARTYQKESIREIYTRVDSVRVRTLAKQVRTLSKSVEKWSRKHPMSLKGRPVFPEDIVTKAVNVLKLYRYEEVLAFRMTQWFADGSNIYRRDLSWCHPFWVQVFEQYHPSVSSEIENYNQWKIRRILEKSTLPAEEITRFIETLPDSSRQSAAFPLKVSGTASTSITSLFLFKFYSYDQGCLIPEAGYYQKIDRRYTQKELEILKSDPVLSIVHRIIAGSF